MSQTEHRTSKKYNANLPCCPQWQTVYSLIWWTEGAMPPPAIKQYTGFHYTGDQIHPPSEKFSENLIMTYFNRAVKVLMEALSCIESEHLNLWRDDMARSKGEWRKTFSFNCCLCSYPRPAGGMVVRREFDWLLTSPLGHQLVGRLILWTLQGLESEVLVSDLTAALLGYNKH